MMHPPFKPHALPPGWSYAITRVIRVAGGHLVLYTKQDGEGTEEHRVSFVCADPFGDWDLITKSVSVKIARVRLPPEKIKRVQL